MQLSGKATGFFATGITAAAQRFARDETGATSVEYGMIVGMISLAIVATLTSIGTTIRDDVFSVLSTAMSGGEAE